MSDPNKLAAIAEGLRKVATDCTNASHTLQQQGQQLDSTAQDLTVGTSKWAGKGSQSFLSAWSDYHRDTNKSCRELDQTAQALNKLAQAIEENVQKIRDAQAQEAGSVFLTGLLFVADVAQLGLDPLTDGATVAAGGADVAIAEEVTAAEEAIVEMDAQVSSELDEITSQIENSSEPGDINITEDGAGGSGGTDTGGGGGNGGNGGPPRKTGGGGGGDDGGNTGGGNGGSSGDSGGWDRSITDTSQMDSNLPNQLHYDGTLPGGGRSGGARPFEGTPNSYVQTPGGHTFVYDNEGRLIYDISTDRVKMTVWDEAPNGRLYPRDVKLTGPIPPEWLDLLP